MSYGFCSKFHMLSSHGKNVENRLRFDFDKVTESLKVGTFLRHSVETECSEEAVLRSFIQFINPHQQ